MCEVLRTNLGRERVASRIGENLHPLHETPGAEKTEQGAECPTRSTPTLSLTLA